MNSEDPELQFHRSLLSNRGSIAGVALIGMLLVIAGVAYGLADVLRAALIWGMPGVFIAGLAIVLWKQEPARLEARLARRIVKIGTLLTNDEGIHISREGATVAIPWITIERMLVFKRDLLTTDCIFMLITARDGTVFQIHEEMIGWQRMLEQLCRHLNGATPWSDWWPKVAFPAFRTNPTVVFQRVDQRSRDADCFQPA